MKHAPFITFTLTLFLACTALAADIPAFPGAEGAGAYARGGRGGQVLIVTNTRDYLPGEEEPIPGSLRWAVSTPGPRIVVFEVGGLIDLKSAVVITEPYLTLACQTAPGDGICLRDYAFCLSGTEEVIVRCLRSRLGDRAGLPLDAVAVKAPAVNVIFDHCSASWAIDEVFSINADEPASITIQWSIISEALTESCHPKGMHGNGSILGTAGTLSFHHNIYALNYARNPLIGGQDLRIDFRNNVMYDWAGPGGAGYGSSNGSPQINFVANYYKPGLDTRQHLPGHHFAHSLTRTDSIPINLYWAGNEMEGQKVHRKNNYLLVHIPDWRTVVNWVDQPFVFDGAPITTTSAKRAFQRVLAGAGATAPVRDAVDARVIECIRRGTGRLIDSQEEVGAWPAYASAHPPTDVDRDGMPDAWEKARGLDPASAEDASGDRDGDGYTNIEEYINSLVPATSRASKDRRSVTNGGTDTRTCAGPLSRLRQKRPR